MYDNKSFIGKVSFLQLFFMIHDVLEFIYLVSVERSVDFLFSRGVPLPNIKRDCLKQAWAYKKWLCAIHILK
jgi:hypothetical protein